MGQVLYGSARTTAVIRAAIQRSQESLQALAEQHGIDLQVVKLGRAKRGFVLLPRRWVVERSLSWSARYKRLARDYERLAVSLQQLHYLAFVGPMLAKASGLNLLSGS